MLPELIITGACAFGRALLGVLDQANHGCALLFDRNCWAWRHCNVERHCGQWRDRRPSAR